MVPYTVPSADNFRAQYLTWAYRFAEGHSVRPGTPTLSKWVAKHLSTDPGLRVAFIIGDAKFLKVEELEKFKAAPGWAPLVPYFDRVDFFPELHWYQVLDVCRQTRLFFSPAARLGGPPFEGAMYGVPTVLQGTIHPFQDVNKKNYFPEVLVAGTNEQLVGILEKLHSDHNYYTKIGSAYRNWVEEHNTYAAFLRQLAEFEDILRRQ